MGERWYGHFLNMDASDSSKIRTTIPKLLQMCAEATQLDFKLYMAADWSIWELAIYASTNHVAAFKILHVHHLPYWKFQLRTQWHCHILA